MGRMRADWTSLPEHLLSVIAKRLDTQIDILRFRAVCHSFRSTLPLPPKLFPFPRSVLTSTDFFKGPNPKSDELFVLAKITVYAFQPLNRISDTNDDISEPWLVYVEEREPGDRLQFIDHLFPYSFKNLTELPKSLNLLDYRVTEISKSCELVSPGVFQDEKNYPPRMHPNDIFWGAEVIFTTCLDETDDEFAIMARFGSELSVWRNVDWKWSDMDVSLVLCDQIEKIIYHNHKFYALITRGRTLTLDPKSLTVTEAVEAQQKPLIESRYLDYVFQFMMATFKDDLFLIVRYQNYDDLQEYIKGFRLDEKKCQWVPDVMSTFKDDLFLIVRCGDYDDPEDYVKVFRQRVPVVKSTEFEDLSIFTYDIEYISSVSAREFSERRGQCIYLLPNVFNPGYGHPGEGALIFLVKIWLSWAFLSLPELFS